MRNIIDVCDQLIQVVNENFPDYRKLIINDIERIKRNYSYRAPELEYMDWNDLAKIINDYCNHSEMDMCDIKLLSILCDKTEEEIIKLSLRQL